MLVARMERIVRVHYGGEVIESDDGCAKFSSNMAQKVVAFVKRPKYSELVSRVRNVLGWEEPGVVVDMQGRYDVGHGHSYKVMMQLQGLVEWEADVDSVKESQFKMLEVVAVKKVVKQIEHDIDLNRSPCRGLEGVNVAREVGAEKRMVLQEKECRRGLVPISVHGSAHSSQGDDEAEDDPAGAWRAAKEEAALDEFDEARVGNDLVPRVFGEETTEDAPYDAELAQHTDDVHDVGGEMSEEDCRAFEKVVGRHPRVNEFRDLTGIDHAVVDGGQNMAYIPDHLALEEGYDAGHRARMIVGGQMPEPLRPRNHSVGVRFDARFKPYLREAGLLGVSTVLERGTCPLNAPALSALVDRWRPETHSFHLPCGEMAVTLEDVAMICALPIRGLAVTGSTASHGWKDMVFDLLGLYPEYDTAESKTSGVPLTWLEANFNDLDEDADDEMVQSYCRAYILEMFGAVLFPDASGDVASWMFLPLLRDWHTAGSYSWGSAVLAWLYRQLCRATQRRSASSSLGGCTFLLQVWMWLRLPVGRPAWVESRPWTHPYDQHLRATAYNLYDRPGLNIGRRKDLYISYTNEMDSLHPNQVEWTPYASSQVQNLQLNYHCLADRNLWGMRAPLICFFVVEYHLPHRVQRQFGLFQPCPPEPFSTSMRLHKMDRQKCKKITDWLHERIRSRCRKMAARLGCRRGVVEDVVEHPTSSRGPSASNVQSRATSSRGDMEGTSHVQDDDEEDVEDDGEENEEDDDEEDDEEEDDNVVPDELGASQLGDAPSPSKATQRAGRKQARDRLQIRSLTMSDNNSRPPLVTTTKLRRDLDAALARWEDGPLANDPNRDTFLNPQPPPTGFEGAPHCHCGMRCVGSTSKDINTWGRRMWKCGQEARNDLETYPSTTASRAKHPAQTFSEYATLPKGCDFIKWINNSMSPKDQEWVNLKKKWELDELRDKFKAGGSSKGNDDDENFGES
ncbi:hypothetical protein EJB05_34018, partial [Eragrostis curvula]